MNKAATCQPLSVL